MNPVESGPLRQFVAVAEELSFARAAERLTMSSPALSRTISRLEAQLDVTLFERSTRHVALTAAGQTLLDESRAALDTLDAAALRAQRAARSEGTLVVAVKADLDGGLLDETIAAYEREPGGGAVDVHFSGWGEQARAVIAGEADVALVFQPQEHMDERALDFDQLTEEPQVATLPAGHPLAARAALELADLEATHVRFPDSGLWRPRDAPDERPRVTDMSQLLKRVELGELLALLPASVATRFGRPEIAYRPVRDAEPARLAVAWPRTSSSLAVAAFVRVIGDVAATRPGAVRSARSGNASSAAAI